MYEYQEKVKTHPIIKVWLVRIEAALAAMSGVEVEFVTTWEDRSPETQVYHDHANQHVAAFLPPLIMSNEAPHFMDEECLPYYSIRFQDGAEILADDAELFSLDARFVELIAAVSGAFAIAREMDFASPWHLAADGSDDQHAHFLASYQTRWSAVPPTHWILNANAPPRYINFENGEVLGLGADGGVIQWNGKKRAAYNCGKSLLEWGIHDLRTHELNRVGIFQEQFDVSIRAHAAVKT
jgi:hypothetical protein